jgi:hypothetical protein
MRRVKHLRRTRGLASLILSFELQNRSHFGESWVRFQQRDEGDLLLKLIVETNEKGVDEGAVVDVITEFPKFVTDGLDALAEDGDGGVALSAGAELDVKSVDVRVGVVLKELLKSGP